MQKCAVNMLRDGLACPRGNRTRRRRRVLLGRLCPSLGRFRRRSAVQFVFDLVDSVFRSSPSSLFFSKSIFSKSPAPRVPSPLASPCSLHSSRAPSPAAVDHRRRQQNHRTRRRRPTFFFLAPMSGMYLRSPIPPHNMSDVAHHFRIHRLEYDVDVAAWQPGNAADWSCAFPAPRPIHLLSGSPFHADICLGLIMYIVPCVLRIELCLQYHPRPRTQYRSMKGRNQGNRLVM